MEGEQFPAHGDVHQGTEIAGRDSEADRELQRRAAAG
jgi:hypothetical protein